jgi:hypothetical protein
MGTIQNVDAALLMRLKYTGDTGVLKQMDIRLYIIVLTEFKDRGGLPKGEYVRTLCQMALAEYMDDHTCPECGGKSPRTAEILSHVLKEEICAICHDTGRLYPSDDDRAVIVGIHRKMWDRVSPMYRRIQGILWDLEGNAIVDMADVLFEEAG